MLTRSQNGRLAWGTLVAAAELASEHDQIGDALSHALWQVATSDEEAAKSVAAQITAEVPPPQLADDLAALPASHERDRFLDYVNEFSTSFLLIVCIGRQGRRVVKFAYDVPWEVERGPVRARLGLIPSDFYFGVPAIDQGASYHFELEPPEGLELAEGWLGLIRSGQTEVEVVHGLENPALLHVYAGELQPGSVREAVVVAGLRPAVRGLVLTSFWTSVFAVVLLGAGSFFSDHLAGVDESAGAALVLALPATVAAYGARPTEHKVASQLLRGLRALLLSVAGVLYFAAVFLVVGVSEGVLRVSWTTGALVALVCALIVGKVMSQVPRTHR